KSAYASAFLATKRFRSRCSKKSKPTCDRGWRSAVAGRIEDCNAAANRVCWAFHMFKKLIAKLRGKGSTKPAAPKESQSGQPPHSAKSNSSRSSRPAKVAKTESPRQTGGPRGSRSRGNRGRDRGRDSRPERDS